MRRSLFGLTLLACVLLGSSRPDRTWFTEVTEKLGLQGARPLRIAVADVNGDNYPDLLFVSRANQAQLLRAV